MCIFQEAIDHCRWKGVLRNDILTKSELQECHLHEFSSKTFEEILLCVYDVCNTVVGIGMLTVYDITAAICRYHNIPIERVYIIGKGPMRAIHLLKIKAKKQKIRGVRTLQYVEISEIVRAFHEQNYDLDIVLKNTTNGDAFESFLCNWQKDK